MVVQNLETPSYSSFSYLNNMQVGIHVVMNFDKGDDKVLILIKPSLGACK